MQLDSGHNSHMSAIAESILVFGLYAPFGGSGGHSRPTNDREGVIVFATLLTVCLLFYLYYTLKIRWTRPPRDDEQDEI